MLFCRTHGSIFDGNFGIVKDTVGKSQRGPTYPLIFGNILTTSSRRHRTRAAHVVRPPHVTGLPMAVLGYGSAPLNPSSALRNLIRETYSRTLSWRSRSPLDGQVTPQVTPAWLALGSPPLPSHPPPGPGLLLSSALDTLLLVDLPE